jgi:hypothetical protein
MPVFLQTAERKHKFESFDVVHEIGESGLIFEDDATLVGIFFEKSGMLCLSATDSDFNLDGVMIQHRNGHFTADGRVVRMDMFGNLMSDNGVIYLGAGSLILTIMAGFKAVLDE